MPELTGIEVLQKRQQALLPAIIFTTAFDNYALPAFDCEAIDYLLKPFERERFDKAFKRAMDYVAFIKNKTKKNFLLHISVKTGSRTDLIPVDDIQYFQPEGAYVQAMTENKTYLIPDSMYDLEAALDPSQFSRVHRSVIVNIKSIKSIRSLLNGDHMLILNNGKEIRASRTYKEKLQEVFKKI
jgi:two-component system, LytTR family, response regulator